MKISTVSAVISALFMCQCLTFQNARADLPESASVKVAQSRITQSKQWAQWILSQVSALPSTQAIEAGTRVADEQRIAMQQPLFNPELNAFYTDKDDEEYGVVWSQTIDWFDKRSANSRLGQVDYELLTLDKLQQTENKLARALFAYIEYSTAKQLLDIAKKQENLLAQLSANLKIREDAGDIELIDAEMAYLSLSENLQHISLTQIRYKKASASLEKALNVHTIPAFPAASVWENDLADIETLEYIEKGLNIQYARKQIEQSIAQAKIAQLDKKVNPTVGLGAGRDGDENTILFEISVPLNIRNNFSSQYRASLHKVSQSELELLAKRRVLEQEINLGLENYQYLKKRASLWRKLTGKRLNNSQKLLTKQWQSGDVTTSDYLFSLQRRSNSLVANIELNSEMKKAWVEWLLATSQLRSWLKNL